MTQPAAATDDQQSSVKETFISIAIAFALAFVFRGFVVEAFLIPTGSMGPTLLGQHLRFVSPVSGEDWAASPRENKGAAAEPLPFQGHPSNPITVHDPMSRYAIRDYNIRTRGGDRIFVLKYLYSVYDPQRFDVVVFKNPTNPGENFIKRLLGLPGEQIALIDGDVFYRTWSGDEKDSPNPWALPGWRIARKPERSQLACWQPLFDSSYTPIRSEQDGRRFFVSPWEPVNRGEAGTDWDVKDRPDYLYTGHGPTALEWNTQARPITDAYPYNEIPPIGYPAAQQFPVSDLRMSLGIRPGAGAEKVSAVLLVRGQQFRATLAPGADGACTATIEQRAGDAGPDAPWTTLDERAGLHALREGEVTNIDFWHADQALTLYVNEARVAHAEYDWTPAQRVKNALNLDLAGVMAGNESILADPSLYRRPGVRFEFAGGPFTLYRVALARDLHYQPDVYKPGSNRGGHPANATSPKSTPALTKDQFFTCGDNSPESFDARLWNPPDPWVAAIDPTQGVVNRDLLIGKAFFVYFPAMYRNARVPVPDFGRMRFIW